MRTNTTLERQAYSLEELARMMGKHRSWAYRQARAGRIKTITGFGTTLVPAEELKRMLEVEEPVKEDAP